MIRLSLLAVVLLSFAASAAPSRAQIAAARAADEPSPFCELFPTFYGCDEIMSREVKELLARARAAFGRNDLALAVEDLDLAIGKMPKCYDCFMLRGDVYTRMRNAMKAITDYTAAIALAPKQPFAYGKRGEVRRLTHDYRGAVADFELAYAYSRDQYYVFARGLAYSSDRRTRSAMSDFSSIIVAPRSPSMKLYALVARAYAAINGAEVEGRDARRIILAADKDLADAHALYPNDGASCVIDLGHGMLEILAGNTWRGGTDVRNARGRCEKLARRQFGLIRDPLNGGSFVSGEADF